MHRWTKIILKSKAQQEEKLSKRNAHTNTKSSRERTETAENSGARKVNQRYCLGLYSSKFYPKASNSKDEEHHSLITLTRQESLFGILQKIRKPETNTSFLKKGAGLGGQGRGKVLRGLGEE